MFAPCGLFYSTSQRSKNLVFCTSVQANYFIPAHERSHSALFTCTTVKKQMEAKSRSLGEQLPPCNRILTSMCTINSWSKRILQKKSIEEIQIITTVEEITGSFQEFHERRQKYPTFI